MVGKRQVATLVAEFLGTGILTLIILSVQRSTIGVPFFVAMAAGLTLALMVFALGRTSGGHFNPAITLGFWTLRKISTLQAVLYIVVQMLGALAAYYLYTYFVKNTLPDVGGKFDAHILVAEVVGTAIFGFGVAAAVYQGFSRAVTASFIGLSLMLGAVAASSAAIGLLNPAVAFGVKAWVLGTYVLGPIIGAVIGMNLYALLFNESEAEAAPGKPSDVAAPAPAAVAAKATRAKSTSKKAPAKKKSAAKKTTRKKK